MSQAQPLQLCRALLDLLIPPPLGSGRNCGEPVGKAEGEALGRG